jgi:hypothetical protein
MDTRSIGIIDNLFEVEATRGLRFFTFTKRNTGFRPYLPLSSKFGLRTGEIFLRPKDHTRVVPGVSDIHDRAPVKGRLITDKGFNNKEDT